MHKNCERPLRRRERLEVVIDHLNRLSFYPLPLGGDKGMVLATLRPSPLAALPKGEGTGASIHLSPPLRLVVLRERFNQIIKGEPQTPTVMEEEKRKC
jgi:hypothetical protein